MSKKDIFISYKAEEFDQANWVKERLEAQGISCWMAPLSIIGGASYASEIPKAIRECKIFVLILSEKVQMSKWVPRELDQAINDEKVIMPFMIENCPLNDAFRFYLTNVQRYYGYDGMDVAMKKMVTEMKAILGIEESEAEESSSEKKYSKKKEKKQKKESNLNKKKNTKKILGIVGGVLVAAIGAFFLIDALTHVTIAGEKFKKSAYTVKLEDATLDQTDINNLRKFKDADYIGFIRCDILPEDISAITDCAQLYRLGLEDCDLSLLQLQSLDFSKQYYLHELNLSGNPALGKFEYLNGTESLTGLEALYLANTGLTDISFMKLYPSVITLSVENNDITSLDPLAACIYMENIYAGGNALTALDGLENMTLLETVDISDNQITDISVLGKSLSSLAELYMENNQISDISCLAGGVKLSYVSVDNNQITSLAALGNSPELKVISASNNLLTSIDGVGGHSMLQLLDLSNNQITSMDSDIPLTMMKDYYGVLDLSYNQISELQISEIVKLSQLFIQGNPIGDMTQVAAIQGTRVSFDYSEKIDWSVFQDDRWGGYMIAEVPLDQQVFLKDVLGEYYVEYVDDAQIQEEKARYIEEDFYYYR